jgi:hypothetical protein
MQIIIIKPMFTHFMIHEGLYHSDHKDNEHSFLNCSSRQGPSLIIMNIIIAMAYLLPEAYPVLVRELAGGDAEVDAQPVNRHRLHLVHL